MKANEIKDGKDLMIGDLVLGCIETDIVGEAAYKILCKVTNINHYGDVSCEALEPFPDELDWQDGDDFSWIEPIPLTPEILEKNGWEWEERHSQWELIVETIHIGWGFYKGCISVSDWADEGNSQITSLRCEFVHELQHALKLCKIDKEVEP